MKCSKIAPSCLKKCEKVVSCGHPCTRKCGEQCGGCEVLIQSHNQLKCGHSQRIFCGKERDITERPLWCNQICGKILECGHVCNLICGTDCLHGKLHGPCKEPCKRKLICGHDCSGRSLFYLTSYFLYLNCGHN